MIEMLGVLAIIGVLSAGGIMGYSVAMDNYKANNLVKDIKEIVASYSAMFPSSSSAASAAVSLQNLCNLNIVKGDYCSKAVSTMETRDLWGNKMGLYADVLSSSYLVVEGGGVCVYAPANYVSLRLYNLPPRACVKMLITDWNDIAPLGRKRFWIYGYGGITSPNSIPIVNPLSAMRAEQLCNGAKTLTEPYMTLLLFVMGQKKACP